MQVFKQYFKIIRKSVFWSLFMYAFIFIGMTILFSTTGGGSSSDFEATKCKVAIINEDDSALASNIEKFIKSNSTVVTLENNEDSIKDSLFFRDSELVITIPKGFGEAFNSESPINLQIQSIPDSTSSIFVKNMINSYLNTTSLYLSNSGIKDFNEIGTLVEMDLSKETTVNISNSGNLKEKNGSYYYFNYLCYPLLCMLILGISLISGIFNSKDLKMRNLCSPISIKKFNIQLFLGHIILAMFIWLLFIIISFIMYPDEIASFNGLLHIINSLIFTITALSLSFFIGNIATKNSIPAICNCVALGSCFLGGAFVPQEMLSSTVVKLSMINPVYWYVHINDTISSMSKFNFAAVKPILFELMILIAFAIAFLSIGLVTVKQKSLTASNE